MSWSRKGPAQFQLDYGRMRSQEPGKDEEKSGVWAVEVLGSNHELTSG